MGHEAGKRRLGFLLPRVGRLEKGTFVTSGGGSFKGGEEKPKGLTARDENKVAKPSTKREREKEKSIRKGVKRRKGLYTSGRVLSEKRGLEGAKKKRG